MNMTISDASLLELSAATARNPHELLGPHARDGGLVVRAWLPAAASVALVDLESRRRFPMTRVAEEGLFELELPERTQSFSYALEIADAEGSVRLDHDPYRFGPTLSGYDLQLFAEGSHPRIHERLGSHLRTIDGVEGASFAVWAPTARRVSVAGTFNGWDGRRHMMRRLGDGGVWEIFVPDVKDGDLYKYEMLPEAGQPILKPDPFAFAAEVPPHTASIVRRMNVWQWRDGEWMRNRPMRDRSDQPMSIYEVHAGSWRLDADPGGGVPKPLDFRTLADSLVPHARDAGFTHIELMPVAEHASDDGRGSSITCFHAVSARFGAPDDFRCFVDACHRAGLGVLLDWTPAGFSADIDGLAHYDGSACYERIGPGEGAYGGLIPFDHDRPEVRSFLISNAMFWLESFHLDGLRIASLEELLYLEPVSRYCEDGSGPGAGENIAAVRFLRQLNRVVSQQAPQTLMIAEDRSGWPMLTRPTSEGGLGFTHRWNLDWQRDFLRYMSLDAMDRRDSQRLLTRTPARAWNERSILPLPHDVVAPGRKSLLGRMPGDPWQQFAGLRAAYGWFFTHPGRKLLFMGGEFGQPDEWNCRGSLDWNLPGREPHAGLIACVRALNRLYVSEPALHEVESVMDGFEWIDSADADRGILSFLRKGRDWRDLLVVACCFTPWPQTDYRIGAPLDAGYAEIFNSDRREFGGSGMTNEGLLRIDQMPYHGKPYSLRLNIPPLSVLVLKPDLSRFRD